MFVILVFQKFLAWMIVIFTLAIYMYFKHKISRCTCIFSSSYSSPYGINILVQSFIYLYMKYLWCYESTTLEAATSLF